MSIMRNLQRYMLAVGLALAIVTSTIACEEIREREIYTRVGFSVDSIDIDNLFISTDGNGIYNSSHIDFDFSVDISNSDCRFLIDNNNVLFVDTSIVLTRQEKPYGMTIYTHRKRHYLDQMPCETTYNSFTRSHVWDAKDILGGTVPPGIYDVRLDGVLYAHDAFESSNIRLSDDSLEDGYIEVSPDPSDAELLIMERNRNSRVVPILTESCRNYPFFHDLIEADPDILKSQNEITYKLHGTSVLSVFDDVLLNVDAESGCHVALTDKQVAVWQSLFVDTGGRIRIEWSCNGTPYRIHFLDVIGPQRTGSIDYAISEYIEAAWPSLEVLYKINSWEKLRYISRNNSGQGRWTVLFGHDVVHSDGDLPSDVSKVGLDRILSSGTEERYPVLNDFLEVRMASCEHIFRVMTIYSDWHPVDIINPVLISENRAVDNVCSVSDIDDIDCCGSYECGGPIDTYYTYYADDDIPLVYDIQLENGELSRGLAGYDGYLVNVSSGAIEVNYDPVKYTNVYHEVVPIRPGNLAALGAGIYKFENNIELVPLSEAQLFDPEADMRCQKKKYRSGETRCEYPSPICTLGPNGEIDGCSGFLRYYLSHRSPYFEAVSLNQAVYMPFSIGNTGLHSCTGPDGSPALCVPHYYGNPTVDTSIGGVCTTPPCDNVNPYYSSRLGHYNSEFLHAQAYHMLSLNKLFYDRLKSDPTSLDVKTKEKLYFLVDSRPTGNRPLGWPFPGEYHSLCTPGSGGIWNPADDDECHLCDWAGGGHCLFLPDVSCVDPNGDDCFTGDNSWWGNQGWDDHLDCWEVDPNATGSRWNPTATWASVNGAEGICDSARGGGAYRPSKLLGDARTARKVHFLGLSYPKIDEDATGYRGFRMELGNSFAAMRNVVGHEYWHYMQRQNLGNTDTAHSPFSQVISEGQANMHSIFNNVGVMAESCWNLYNHDFDVPGNRYFGGDVCQDDETDDPNDNYNCPSCDRHGRHTSCVSPGDPTYEWNSHASTQWMEGLGFHLSLINGHPWGPALSTGASLKGWNRETRATGPCNSVYCKHTCSDEYNEFNYELYEAFDIHIDEDRVNLTQYDEYPGTVLVADGLTAARGSNRDIYFDNDRNPIGTRAISGSINGALDTDVFQVHLDVRQNEKYTIRRLHDSGMPVWVEVTNGINSTYLNLDDESDDPKEIDTGDMVTQDNKFSVIVRLNHAKYSGWGFVIPFWPYQYVIEGPSAPTSFPENGDEYIRYEGTENNAGRMLNSFGEGVSGTLKTFPEIGVNRPAINTYWVYLGGGERHRFILRTRRGHFVGEEVEVDFHHLTNPHSFNVVLHTAPTGPGSFSTWAIESTTDGNFTVPIWAGGWYVIRIKGIPTVEPSRDEGEYTLLVRSEEGILDTEGVVCNPMARSRAETLGYCVFDFVNVDSDLLGGSRLPLSSYLEEPRYRVRKGVVDPTIADASASRYFVSALEGDRINITLQHEAWNSSVENLQLRLYNSEGYESGYSMISLCNRPVLVKNMYDNKNLDVLEDADFIEDDSFITLSFEAPLNGDYAVEVGLREPDTLTWPVYYALHIQNNVE